MFQITQKAIAERTNRQVLSKTNAEEVVVPPVVTAVNPKCNKKTVLDELYIKTKKKREMKETEERKKSGTTL